MKARSFRPGAVILAAILLALAAKAFVIDAAVVDGPSMRPTLEPGRLVFVLRCAYGLRLPTSSRAGGRYLLRWASPRRGELVAAASPRDGLPVVKRVAAAGPSSLSYAAGRLLGPGLDASISADQAKALGSPFLLVEDSFFLLGDNPRESSDSRDYGPVPIEAVWGRVLLFGGRAIR
jgi:signal peptidase I